MKTKNIVNFFDPYNIDHIKAWKYLEEHGFWPEGFIPEGINLPTLWQVSISANIAKCWIDYMIERKGVFNDRLNK